MNQHEFNAFCQNWPATSYVMLWGNTHVWKVGAKVLPLADGAKQKNQPFLSRRLSTMSDFFRASQE